MSRYVLSNPDHYSLIYNPSLRPSLEVGQQNQKPFKLTALSLHKPELAVAVLLGHADVFIAKWNTELIFLFG